jgi:hypothetical protein
MTLLTTERRQSVYFATFRTALAAAAVIALGSEFLAKGAANFPVFNLTSPTGREFFDFRGV